MRLKRLAQAVAVTLTLLIGVLVLALVTTQTAWFRNWLRGYITREAHQYLNGELSIGRLNGNLFFGVELEDVAVALNNRPVVAVKDIKLRYNTLEFLRRGVSIDAIHIDQPAVHFSRDGETWTIFRLIKKDAQEADRKGPGRPLTIDDITLSAGSLIFDQPLVVPGLVVPAAIDDLDLQLAFKYEPVHYSVEIGHVSFHGSQPSFAVNDLTGGVAVFGDRVALDKLTLKTGESMLTIDGGIQDYLTNPSLALQVASDGISLPEIGRVVPSVAGIDLKPTIALKVSGRLEQMAAEMSIQSPAGNIDGTVAADLAEPDVSVRGELRVSHLNAASLTGQREQATDLTAVIKPDLRAASFSKIDSLRGDVVVTTPAISGAGYRVDRVAGKATFTGRHVVVDGAARAYQADATFRGSVDLPVERRPVSFNLRGVVHRLNLLSLPRQLQAPRVETNVNAAYRVAGTGTSRFNTEIQFADSRLPGARIESPSTVTAAVRLNPGHTPQVDYQADLTASDVDLQRLGRAFAIRALDHARYETLLNLRARAAGHGVALESMETSVSGTLSDSRLLGGRIPELTFDATLAADTAHVRATGSVADLDPAVASETPRAEGKVTGSLDVDATVAQVSQGFDVDRVQGAARLALAPSQVGKLRVEHGTVDASLERSLLTVRSLELNGPDVTVQANGAVSLTPDGDSHLTAHADSSDLATIGELVDQPLAGIASVDATITGNRAQLHATGTLTGSGVSVGDYSALTLSSDYTVDVPNLTPADANVSATTKGTFLTLAGQNINELTAKADYDHARLDLDVTAKQPNRSLSGAGTVVLNPDDRELRLTRLDLSTEQVQWKMAPDTEACVRYGGGVVTVKELRLVSGNQQITADGSFGKDTNASEPLTITAKQVDLAQVDAIMLRPPQFSGVLDASAVVTGTAESPEARGEFAITDGGFRAFHYQDFKGTASYNNKGVTMDSRLQQNPNAQVQVSGFVPATAWKAPDEVAAGDAAGGDQFDLRIESTPIDLGIVQGFTTELTNVTGTVQADVRVAGPGGDPRPNGQFTLTNGAFTVASTGVPYAQLNGRIELQNDRVHVAQLDVLDNASSPLSLTGDIPIRRALTGDVNLQITARDFKVLDNKMGKVRIDTDLVVAGELRAPRLEGDIAVTTGNVNLDPILAAAGGGAYATKPIELGESGKTDAVADTETDSTAPSAPGIRNTAIDVRLTVPNDFVVKSSDLKAAAAPIGLGALNITLGGDLRATKEPNGSIRLDGAINTVRGTYDFQGRQFTILRDGQVRFDGNSIDQLNPTLDVRTERLIQGVQANVDIRGTLQRPRIELTSVPPLERADILSLIVFNQPVNELGEGQQVSLGQRAEQLALGSITGELSKSLGSLLNVSEFQIQTAPDSGAAAQLTVGQQVSRRLFVKLEQGVGDVSTTNAVLEYELKEWLRLQTNLIQAAAAQQALFQAVRDSGFDLIFVFTR